jgi:uncharacterized protein (DUF983 family)
VARGLDDPVEAPTPSRMVLRGLVGRCPLCAGRGLFERWFTMADRCPTCGHRFERKPEEGFFLGAYTLNLSLVLTLLCIDLFLYGLATGDVIAVPDWSLVVGAVVIAVVVPLLGYPASKTTWSAIDLAMNPPEPVEQAEAVAHVESRRAG